MTLLDAMKKVMFAGFGIQEKVKEFVEELVQKGELSESQGANLLKEWSGKAEKSTEDFNKALNELISKSLEKMNIPTKDELKALDEKISALALKVDLLELKKGEVS